MVRQIFHDYALLQNHCLEHASAVANEGVPGAADDEQQHIITYIAGPKENPGQPSDGDQIMVQVAADGTVDLQPGQQHQQQQQQFVIVYDHGDEGTLPNVVEMQQ